MNRELVDKIVNAVLYEGYILYPYRASSKKNQRERFTFGRVYPRKYSDAQNGREPFLMQTECLVRNESHDAALEITVRFLQPLARETGEQLRHGTDSSERRIWLEAIEREVKLSTIPLNKAIARSHLFKFPAAQRIDGAVIRRSEAINGKVELETHAIDSAMVRIRV